MSAYVPPPNSDYKSVKAQAAYRTSNQRSLILLGIGALFRAVYLALKWIVTLPLRPFRSNS